MCRTLWAPQRGDHFQPRLFTMGSVIQKPHDDRSRDWPRRPPQYYCRIRKGDVQPQSRSSRITSSGNSLICTLQNPPAEVDLQWECVELTLFLAFYPWAFLIVVMGISSCRWQGCPVRQGSVTQPCQLQMVEVDGNNEIIYILDWVTPVLLDDSRGENYHFKQVIPSRLISHL